MITAIISFSLCSGLLLGIYHLLLKGKTLYTFNRHYLLFSLAFSLAVPFITLKTSVPAIEALKPVANNIIILPADEHYQVAEQDKLPLHDNMPAARIVHQSKNYWPDAIWGLYILVASALLYRFGRNLYLIRRSIKNSEQHSYKGTRLILTERPLTPYTFLHYIFLNKADHAKQAIDPAILKHELTHARQLHSIDIILIELLQAICWFNPFILFYRKAIELNHEFIADAAALGHKADVASYQYLLLNTVSYSSGLSLTSQFNYLTIKKRLIMMNRSTTSAKAILARAAIVPVFAVAFLLFCAKTDGFAIPAVVKNIKLAPIVVKEAPHKDTVAKHKFPPPTIGIFPCTKEGVSADVLKQYQDLIDKYSGPTNIPRYSIARIPGKVSPEDRDKLEAMYKQMSREQQSQQMVGFYYPGPPLPAHKPTQKELDKWKDPKYCGLWLNGKKADNTELNNYKPSDLGNAFISRLYGVARKNKIYKYQVDVYTIDAYAKIRKQMIADEHKSFMYYRMQKKTKA